MYSGSVVLLVNGLSLSSLFSLYIFFDGTFSLFPLSVDRMLAALDLELCFTFLLHICFPSACT